MSQTTSQMNRANVLIDKMLSSAPELFDELAQALMATPKLLGEYRAGRAVPIERQMLLAVYAIERAPAYARLGHLLRGQIRAAIAFAARDTEIHRGPPPFRPRDRWP